MKVFAIIAGVFGGFVVLIALLFAFMYFKYANIGNSYENQLKAIVENNENIYANATQKIVEIAQVTDNYKDDVAKVTKEAIQGRYGQDGSKAIFQMLREQNPQLDAKLYTRIQDEIVIFRNQFANEQKNMIDVKRSYKTLLGAPWTGFWLNFAGYPKEDLKQFDIVTTNKARQTFDTKRDDGINLKRQ